MSLIKHVVLYPLAILPLFTGLLFAYWFPAKWVQLTCHKCHLRDARYVIVKVIALRLGCTEGVAYNRGVACVVPCRVVYLLKSSLHDTQLISTLGVTSCIPPYKDLIVHTSL